MKIVNNYSGVKVNVDIVFNEKLDSFVHCVGYQDNPYEAIKVQRFI